MPENESETNLNNSKSREDLWDNIPINDKYLSAMPPNELGTHASNEFADAMEWRREQGYRQFGIVGSFALSVSNALKTTVSAIRGPFGSAAAKNEGPKHDGPQGPGQG